MTDGPRKRVQGGYRPPSGLEEKGLRPRPTDQPKPPPPAGTGAGSAPKGKN